MSTSEEDELRAKLKEATDANDGMKAHIDHLNIILNSQRDQLDEYRGHLSELSQSHDDVSEDHIRKSFQSIFDGMEIWIDQLSSEPGFDERFATDFAEVFRDNTGRSTLDRLVNGAEIDWYEVGRSQGCPYIVLSLIIGDFLERDVFRLIEMAKYGHVFPREFRHEHMRVLSKIQQKIGQQSPESDIKGSRWRAEAVAALISERTSTDELRSSLSNDVAYEIFNLTGQEISPEQKDSLQVKVVDRALRALRVIAGSSKEYIFLGSGNKPGQWESRSSEWISKDIYSWRGQSQYSTRDSVLKALYPGLARREDSRGPSSTLVSPTYLVTRSKSRTPSPRKSGAKTPTREMSSQKTHTLHHERPHRLPPSFEPRERTTVTKGAKGVDGNQGIGSKISRTTSDISNLFSFKSLDKSQKVVKQQEPSRPRGSSTFPVTRRNHQRRQTSSGSRRRREEADIEADISHGREVQSQDDCRAQTWDSTQQPFERGLLSESYSQDPKSWNVAENYEQAFPSVDREGRSNSMSYG